MHWEACFQHISTVRNYIKHFYYYVWLLCDCIVVTTLLQSPNANEIKFEPSFDINNKKKLFKCGLDFYIALEIRILIWSGQNL